MGTYESPHYELLQSSGNCEVRRYNPFQIIRYSDESDPGAKKGFRTLFRYILGGNEAGEKISMTVPVLQ